MIQGIVYHAHQITIYNEDIFVKCHKRVSKLVIYNYSENLLIRKLKFNN